jgi:hypothetical protein
MKEGEMKSLRVTHIKKVPAEVEVGFEVNDPQDWEIFLDMYEKMFTEKEIQGHKIGFAMRKAMEDSAELWKDDDRMKEYATKELKRQYDTMVDLLKRVVNTVCAQTWEEKDEKAIFELTDEVEEFLTDDIFKKHEVEDEYFPEEEDEEYLTESELTIRNLEDENQELRQKPDEWDLAEANEKTGEEVIKEAQEAINSECINPDCDCDGNCGDDCTCKDNIPSGGIDPKELKLSDKDKQDIKDELEISDDEVKEQIPV